MTNHDPKIIKALAELGVIVAPKKNSPDVQQVLDRIKEYEREIGTRLDPQTLAKYLG